jgi:hypothetical protein
MEGGVKELDRASGRPKAVLDAERAEGRMPGPGHLAICSTT